MAREHKPTALKLLEGDDYKHPERINPNEPSVPNGRPPRPEYLVGHEAEGWDVFWNNLDEMGLSSPVWAPSALLFADSWKGWRDAREKCDSLGGEVLVTKGTKGTEVKRNPYSVVMHKHKDFLCKMLSEFGQTASSKARVATVGKLENDPLADFMESA